ncbi:MAG TPA: hypothetical protein VD931_13390 [Baekduia sp.]|nr:hypothetical protein [Baekduia sp.]
MDERCTWCGVAVGEDAGFRAAEPEADRRAVFCRLEHVVPWVIRGAAWDPGSFLDEEDPDEGLGRCARCGGALGAQRVLLVRHRGHHRIADAFCGVEHLMEWSRAGGRWAPR